MKRVAGILLFMLGLTAPARAGAIVYDNTGGSIFSSSTTPRRGLDDGFFSPGPAGGGDVVITAINVGYAFTGTGGGSMDIRVTFYDTLNAAAPAGTPVNNPTSILGQVVFPVSFSDTQPPVRSTGLVDITGQTEGGIFFPDDDWAVDVEFLNSGTQVPSTRGTPLFAGGAPPNGPSIGNSQDRFWRDVNSNGIYEASELRTLGGAPNRANFYLQLAVPEPGTLVLLIAGAALIAMRRR